MSSNTAYFSTNLGVFDTQKQQTGGIWNITHASIFDPLYLSGGSANRMRSEYGMTWYEMRAQMRYMFTSSVGDKGLIRQIQERVLKEDFFPVRSGKLLDTVMNTMHIVRTQYYSSHYWAQFFFEWPLDYPGAWFGKQVAHHYPPHQGYGKWATYKVSDARVAAKVSIDHVTPGGNALYNLQDQNAIADPRPRLNDIAIEQLEDDFANLFNFTLGVQI